MSTPSRLTIIQLLPELHSGGVEKCTVDMAKAIVAAGHRSIVISHGGQLVKQLVAEGSEHFTLAIHRKSLSSLLQIRPLRSLLAELKPDIVHARSRMPAWLTWLAIRPMPLLLKPRFVTTVHGLNSVNAYSAIMTYGDAVIAISKTVQAFIQSNYPKCPTHKQHLIYEGIDQVDFPYQYQPDDSWLHEWRATNPQLQKKTVLALPGRITRLKGHSAFLRLIAALVKDNHPVHGVIIGGAPPKKQAYLEELKAEVDSLDLQHHVSFIGQRNDMAEVISQCDIIFSLSTQPETFGRTVLEAIRLGKPVLAWDKGGVGEVLSTCYPSGRVEDGNEEALLIATIAWLNAPSTPEKNNSFLQSTNSTLTLHLYRDLLLSRLH